MNYLEEKAKETEEMLISMIKKGTAPWIRPWKNEGILSNPHNPYTGTIYKGFNSRNLLFKQKFHAYESSKYMSFNQIKDLGGNVKKGEKATKIIFSQFISKGDDIDNLQLSKSEKQRLEENGCVIKNRFYPVFNLSQTTLDMEKLREYQEKKGLPKNLIFPRSEESRFEENPLIESILKNSGIEIIHHQKDEAYYRDSVDKIYLPPKESFTSTEQYYSTALHELGHATGHHSRLNRTYGKKFGDENYAKEELRAEIYSYLQAVELGIDYDIKNHASYVGSWIKNLEKNPQEITQAIKDVTKMVDYVKDNWYPKTQIEKNIKDVNLSLDHKLQDIEKTLSSKSPIMSKQKALNELEKINKSVLNFNQKEVVNNLLKQHMPKQRRIV